VAAIKTFLPLKRWQVYVVLVTSVLFAGCNRDADTEGKVRIANQREQAEIITHVLEQAIGQSTAPRQIFCIRNRFNRPFESLQMEQSSQNSQFAPEAKWFENKAANDAFGRLFIKGASADWAESGVVPFPVLKQRYTTCPNNTAVPLDPQGNFYKYRTISLSLPIASGGFVFLEKSYGCGPLCASGELVAFKRNDAGKWYIVEHRGLWIS
jgi:hypothetical protein